MEENQQPHEEEIVQLDGPAAYLLANRLIIVPQFPRDPVAVEQVADWLLDLCKGADVDGDAWTPRDQAGWLIETAITEFANWHHSGGLPAMRSIFARKFNPPPAQIQFQGFGEPPVISCTLCGDNGTVLRDGEIHWCVCPQANKLLVQVPQLVEILNRPSALKRAAELRQPAKVVVQQPDPPETPQQDEQRKAAIRVEIAIAKVKKEREHDARITELRTGPLSWLRWPRLCGMLRNWSRRILRPRVS